MEHRILDILTDYRTRPCGQKGIRPDELCRLTGLDERELYKHIRRARRRCPRGKTIRGYRDKWGTVWHLVRDYNAAPEQVEMFGERAA